MPQSKLPIERILHNLRNHYADYVWTTWERSRNSVVAVAAVMKGFNVELTSHDYRNGSGYVSGKVFHRRPLDPGVNKHWIEISINDIQGRFDRRSLLTNFILHPDTKQYDFALELMKSICPKANILEVHPEGRLSASAALVGFCKEIETK